MARAAIAVSYWHDQRWQIQTVHVDIPNDTMLDRLKFMVGPDTLLDIPFYVPEYGEDDE